MSDSSVKVHSECLTTMLVLVELKQPSVGMLPSFVNQIDAGMPLCQSCIPIVFNVARECSSDALNAIPSYLEPMVYCD